MIAGIGLATLGFYFGFRHIPLDAIVLALSEFNYFWIIPSVVLAVISFALRTIRWQLIVQPVLKIRFFDGFHPLLVGFMVNCIFPARIGEMVRPAVLYRKHQVPFLTGLSTIAIERMFDMVCMILMLAVVLACVSIPPDTAYHFGTYSLGANTLHDIGVGMVKLSLCVICFMLVLCVDKMKHWLLRVLYRFSNGFVYQYVSNSLDHLSHGFSFFKNWKNVCLCVCLSFGVWIVQALAWYVLTFGFSGLHITFFQMSAVMIMVCLFIALPSVPGYWGLWELAGIFAMMLFNVPKELAAGYTIVNHSVQVFTMIGIGGISVFLCGVNIQGIYGFK